MRRDRRSPSPGGAASAFADVAVFDSLEAAQAHWRALESVAPASPYQTLPWLRAWLDTEGAAIGVRPMIVVALDAEGRATALLPLGVRRAGALQVAGFLGGRYANYNMGLFDQPADWSASAVETLLRLGARHWPGRLDVFALVNQPLMWDDRANPLVRLSHQASPSLCHRAVLQPDGEAFLRAHLSSAARKKVRSKTNQLAALGPARHMIATSPAEIDAVVSAYLDQKGARLAAIGMGEGPDDLARQRAFLTRAARATPDAAAPLELHALWCGSRIVATFGGVRGLPQTGRFSGLLISYESQAEFARLSPGQLLLTQVVAGKCAEGFAGFDLGIGEARYKEEFCPIAEPLADSFLPITPAGHVFVAAEAARLRIKGRIKRSTWAWDLAKAVRAWQGRRRRG